jgi:hypothetical protein
LFVFHDAHGFGSARFRLLETTFLGMFVRFSRGGQIDGERGSSSDLARDPNRPVALRDDSINGGQAEPRALAGRLGGEEKFKDVDLPASIPQPVSVTMVRTTASASRVTL